MTYCFMQQPGAPENYRILSLYIKTYILYFWVLSKKLVSLLRYLYYSVLWIISMKNACNQKIRYTHTHIYIVPWQVQNMDSDSEYQKGSVT